MLVKPGIGIDLSSAEEVAEATVGSASLQETLTNFVPTNVIQAMAEGSMVPCIVFALFFGVAMGQYTKNTKNRNVAEDVHDGYHDNFRRDLPSDKDGGCGREVWRQP